MSELFRAIAERLKAALAATTALEIEAELITAHIERKASLLRLAAQCEGEGFGGLAEELRKFAENMNPRQPAATIMPTLSDCETPIIREPSQPASDQPIHQSLPSSPPVTVPKNGASDKQESSARKKR